MERVRKGKFRKEIDQNCELTQLLLRAGVPAWYVESMGKIHYLFPKAHAAHYAKMAATLAWFKVHYPREFYNVTQQNLRVKELLHYSN